MTESGENAADNPLTKDLPGLPIEFRNVRIDETGFHRAATRFRPEAHFTWEQVTAVRCDWSGFVVEGWIDGRAKTLIRMGWTSVAAKRIGKAWQEYRLRLLEQRGTIEGSAVLPRHRSWCRYGPVFGVVYVLALLAMLPAFRSILNSMLPEMVRFRGASVLTAAVWGLLTCAPLVGLAAISMVCLIKFPARYLKAMKRCERWALSRDGLAIWPDGRRRLFAPPQEIVAWLLHKRYHLAARIGGERVALGDHTVAWPVLLALNEREGGQVRSRFWAFALLESLLAGLMWVVTLFVAWLTRADRSGALQDQVYALLVVSVAVSVFVVVLLYWFKKRENRVLAEGREMLKRLGW